MCLETNYILGANIWLSNFRCNANVYAYVNFFVISQLLFVLYFTCFVLQWKRFRAIRHILYLSHKIDAKDIYLLIDQ